MDKKDLRKVLQLLLDGKELQERIALDDGLPPPDRPADRTLRALQRLGVPLSIHQQLLGDCLERVYFIRGDKLHSARRIQANLGKPKAEEQAIP